MYHPPVGKKLCSKLTASFSRQKQRVYILEQEQNKDAFLGCCVFFLFIFPL